MYVSMLKQVHAPYIHIIDDVLKTKSTDNNADD